LGHVRLRAEKAFQGGIDVDQDLAVIAQGLQDGASPAGKARLALRQPVVHQLGEGLIPGGVKSGAFSFRAEPIS